MKIEVVLTLNLCTYCLHLKKLVPILTVRSEYFNYGKGKGGKCEERWRRQREYEKVGEEGKGGSREGGTGRQGESLEYRALMSILQVGLHS